MNDFIWSAIEGKESVECNPGWGQTHANLLSAITPDLIMSHVECPRFSWNQLEELKEIGRGVYLFRVVHMHHAGVARVRIRICARSHTHLHAFAYVSARAFAYASARVRRCICACSHTLLLAFAYHLRAFAYHVHVFTYAATCHSSFANAYVIGAYGIVYKANFGSAPWAVKKLTKVDTGEMSVSTELTNQSTSVFMKKSEKVATFLEFLHEASVLR